MPAIAEFLTQKIHHVEWVAFDTETTGQYPLNAEVCELAAVKWRDGQIVGQFQSLFCVKHPMDQKVIDIHHITNEMLVGAPQITEKLEEFLNFVGDAYLLAHHAPFDLGFLALDLEAMGLEFPQRPVFCTSLLARQIFPESENHRLQTLVRFLNIEPRTAHRALSDAEACLDVGLKCFAKAGDITIGDLITQQTKPLYWSDFSIQLLLQNPVHRAIVEALRQKADLQIEYMGGSRPGTARTIRPVGLVRNPGQDFLVAYDEGESTQTKRYFLAKIRAARL